MAVLPEQNRRGSKAVRALEGAWQHLRATQPEFPPNVAFVAMTVQTAHGHFVESRWSFQKARNLHEIGISARLFGSPRDVLLVMLHEGVHAILAGKNGGCSASPSQAKYHTTLFRDKAMEVGLSCGFYNTRHGWMLTEFPDGNVPPQYVPALNSLSGALPHGMKVSEMTSVSGRPLPEKGQVHLQCACSKPRNIYVSRSVACAGGIICALCRRRFRPTP